MRKDDFVRRRALTILGAAAAIAVVVVGIGLLAVHRAPPRPALGSGDTAATAVSLAMPPAADPGSPVVSQPAPPGQAVPVAAADAAPPAAEPAPTPQPAQSAGNAVQPPVQPYPAGVAPAPAGAERWPNALPASPASAGLPGRRTPSAVAAARVLVAPAVDSSAPVRRPRRRPIAPADSSTVQQAPDSGSAHPASPQQKPDTAGGNNQD